MALKKESGLIQPRIFSLLRSIAPPRRIAALSLTAVKGQGLGVRPLPGIGQRGRLIDFLGPEGIGREKES